METLQDLFDYFEGLDEIVYISDIETNELVFMNCHLREILGYTEKNIYKGKKCYNVLQGNCEPCSFCNNKTLEIGKFETWAHENQVLNQRFVVKDTVVISNGRKYRVEVAYEVNKTGIEKTAYYFTRHKAVLNECLQLFFSTTDPEESLDKLLEYLGNTFHGDRAYIFEISEKDITDNTYEWCAPGIKPQIELLRNLPLSDIGYWVHIFSQGKTVEIQNIEEIRNEHPSTYSLLKPQKIESLVAGAIWDNGRLIGFIGVDNPDPKLVPLLAQVLKELGGYMMSQFQRRDIYQRFNKMSYCDLLTGAYNHNAMIEHNMLSKQWKSFGAVYCDINNLKETNETQGHDAGNHLIQECYDILQRLLNTEWIYHLGKDEFVALYYDTEESVIKNDYEALKLAAIQNTCQISIGYAWSDNQPINTEQIMNRANTMLYKEKEHYYELLTRLLDITPSQNKEALSFSTDKNITDYQMKLQRFLSNTYCDMVFLLATLSNDNGTNYFFFGDMQKNLYFISENMRERFGFKNNVVSDLINEWASRIADEDLLKKFWDDINALLYKRKNCHDLRYKINDVNGNSIWIHCVGEIKWNEDGTKPLFFAGRISHQDEDFVVDNLTNFPTESVLVKHLARIQKSNQNCQLIGFSFHNITQINNHHGRSYGDNLIKEITNKLFDKMSNYLTFYRLSGVRCVALTEPHSDEEIRKIIYQIKSITNEVYQSHGMAFQQTCSFSLMKYPHGDVSPEDFIENIVSLIKVAHQSPSHMYIDDSDGNMKKIQKLSDMENQLIKNIINGMENFRIVIQPVVSTDNGRPVGGETLLRWRFNDEEVSPGVFIPIIENEHMIHVIGRWVFEQAVHSCVRILSYISDFYLTVNVSLQQLYDEGFTDFIRNTLMKYDLDGKHIVIELTESCMDDQPEKLERFVKECNDMNIRIALDDFGSGYSSLRVLLRYPSCIIKLDRSLLVEMTDSFEKNAFITSIVYACHQFGKKVCMEGVETNYQNELVKEAGCDLIQGYYYFKPMEVNKVYKLLAEEYRNK